MVTQNMLKDDAASISSSRVAINLPFFQKSSPESSIRSYTPPRSISSSGQKKSSRSSSKYRRSLSSMSTAAASLPSHEAAELARQDFELNGHRCQTSPESFLLPRMVPDIEVVACTRCSAEFSIFFRRHHCRSCGQIFCHACSAYRMLLEKDYGLANPQRVCLWCHDRLAPLQARLAGTVANRNRTNEINTESYLRYLNLPYSKTMGSELRKAAYSVSNMFHPTVIRDTSLTLPLLQQAQGLAFLTVIKGGFMFAPRMGTGIVISKLPDGRWSAPTAIATAGLSWGALIGLDVTDYVIVLKNTEAVNAFATGNPTVIPSSTSSSAPPAPSSAAATWNPLNTLSFGGVRLSGEVDVAVGGLGRVGYTDLHVGENGAAGAFSYCHSRGLYAGISFGGSLMFARPEVNANFYGQAFSPLQCLRGDVPPPFAANCLYEALYDSVDYLMETHLLASHETSTSGAPAAQAGSTEQRTPKKAAVAVVPESGPTSGGGILGRGVESSKKPRKLNASNRNSLPSDQRQPCGLSKYQ